MKVKVGICFPDNSDVHMLTLRKLLDYYIAVEGSAGETWVKIVIEDDRLVIDVSKGFHCLSIPLDKIRAILGKASRKETTSK